MITWHIGIKTELEDIENSIHDDEIIAKKSSYYKGDEKGSSLHEIDIHVKNDGDMFFSNYNDGEGFIYLYADQIEHLEQILAERKKLLK